MHRIWRQAGVGMAAVVITVTAAFTTAQAAGAATAVPKAQKAAEAPAAALAWPLVVRGATGERVVAIQYLLNQRISAGLAVDGIFGARTEAAVRTFQVRFRLAVDGQVGNQTWTHLIVTVQNGSRGPAVAAVQHNLRFAYGFRTLAVDGVFGPLTRDAVRSFQARFRLAADGIVGPVTWNTLVVHEG